MTSRRRPPTRFALELSLRFGGYNTGSPGTAKLASCVAHRAVYGTPKAKRITKSKRSAITFPCRMLQAVHPAVPGPPRAVTRGLTRAVETLRCQNPTSQACTRVYRCAGDEPRRVLVGCRVPCAVRGGRERGSSNGHAATDRDSPGPRAASRLCESDGARGGAVSPALRSRGRRLLSSGSRIWISLTRTHSSTEFF